MKKLTQRKWSIDLTRRIEQLNLSIRGWINYFSLGNMKSIVTSIDERLRTRLRVIIWKQWKKKSRRLWGLLKLGVPKWIADKVSGWGDHYQLVAQKSVLNVLYQNQSLKNVDWFRVWIITLNDMR
ncbi:maturase-related protein [Streptococcus pseudopneumoniae]|nr:maturase-related protein [Streptococcus pseudopneumoniae]